jgi:exosortase A-associated hydrolase 2
LTNRLAYIEPVYVQGPAGKLLFTLLRPERAGSREAVLCLPPFAEEMNKSRRMLALQGRMLAANGMPFLLPDLFGTGDSDGDFGTATWDVWCEDVAFAADWLARAGYEKLNILALRSGCLLFRSVADRLAGVAGRVAFWAPVTSGEKMLSQFFRTKLVSALQQGSSTSTAEIRAAIHEAGELEIAGYRLTSGLTRAIDDLTLVDLAWPSEQRVLWLDASPASSVRMPAATRRFVDDWTQAGVAVEYHRVHGAQFWMGPEIEEVPEFLSLTTGFLC